MQSQIYVPPMTRDFHKSQIDAFVWVYFAKLSPVFDHIEEEANSLSEEMYNTFMETPSGEDFPDPAEIAEYARDLGIERYHMLGLGNYTLCATWHSTLYEFFEQQLRLFLFKEVSHLFNVDFTTFCVGLVEIKKVFVFHHLDIERLSCWPQVNELRLLSNVIKHGDGRSAYELRSCNPSRFRNESQIDVFKLYKTTLLDETLNIDNSTLRTYVSALNSFWDEIPERSYAD